VPSQSSVRGFKAWYARLHEFRYGFLFTALLAYLIVLPFVEQNYGFVIPLLFFLMLYSVLDTLELKPGIFRMAASIGFLAMVLHILGARYFYRATGDHRFELVVASLYFVFIALCVLILTYRIFTEKTVTGDTVKGGIAVYFLAGLAGALLYAVLLSVQPGGLSGVSQTEHFSSLIYFSFVTMTTLGFGDITPQTPLLRTVVYLQASLGQIYLAVLVARLVGLLGSPEGKR
jgi:hypothetical protein